MKCVQEAEPELRSVSRGYISAGQCRRFPSLTGKKVHLCHIKSITKSVVVVSQQYVPPVM